MTTPRVTLTIDLGERSYPIYIGAGLLADAATLVGVVAGPDILIVTNDTVAPLYGEPVADALRRSGRRVDTVNLPDGEQHKSLATMQLIFDALIERRFNRDAVIVALGGGVIGDVAGFAAATYQRGIDFIQVPTTLLAQVDSSVGGKTGVNHPRGKNMIGAFHQPRCVIADVDTLATLPIREYRAGLAEIVKYGLIYDFGFFEWLERHVDALNARETASLVHAIQRSCEIKAEVVGQDERESGLRAILNFGHTFGHAIEAGAGYGAWLHGEAVASGMAIATDMSRELGYVDRVDAERAADLLRRLQLPTQAPKLGSARTLELMGMDKKVLQGKLRLVLLKRMGEATVTSDYPRDVLERTLARHFD